MKKARLRPDAAAPAPWFIVALCAVAAAAPALSSCATLAARNDTEKYLLELDRITSATGLDLSDLNLAGVSPDLLAEVGFDSRTIWPPSARLPKSFSPQARMEEAKRHPFGLEALHAEGITGKGVAIAVFDKPINADHEEFSGRMTYIKTDAPGEGGGLHFHGISCASIIAGESCGVAPGAALYYFAVPDNARNFENYLIAMDELLSLNESLPEGGKIRLVSVSDGLPPGPLLDDWENAVERARIAGVDVNYSNSLGAKNICYGGSPPSRDPDDPMSYRLSRFLGGVSPSPGLTLVPSDYRTTADNDGGYRYWQMGGFSWAIAYVSGLCALAYQADPDIRYPEILEALRKTSQKGKGMRVVDPVRFIQEIRKAR